MLKATHDKWVAATANLNARRGTVSLENDNVHCEDKISNYFLHLAKCGVGKSVLDVGCGTQYLKRQIPHGVEYIGIDAFPINDSVTKLAIEDEAALKLSVDTVCAFAVLDNCLDFHKAIANMKAIAKKNIIILTGIGIEVDKFHTLKLELSDFDLAFSDWESRHREEIAPKVYLLSYGRKG